MAVKQQEQHPIIHHSVPVDAGSGYTHEDEPYEKHRSLDACGDAADGWRIRCEGVIGRIPETVRGTAARVRRF